MTNIAEDDNLRSNYIHELLLETTAAKVETSVSDIPKVIVQFWHDLNNIPEDVKGCLNSWATLNDKGFDRVLFDNDSAREFILREFDNSHAKAFDRCHHPAMRCDYFRLCYLLIRGGFYVDADEVYQGKDLDHYFQDNTLKIQPLCYDTATGEMISPKIFIKKEEYSKNWIYYFNNNPLIGPASHPIIRAALERSTNLLLASRKKTLEIQSTTGPGNLSASVVKHSIACKSQTIQRDFMVISDWEEIAFSKWPLSYRNDKRNWRLWNPIEKWDDYSF